MTQGIDIAPPARPRTPQAASDQPGDARRPSEPDQPADRDQLLQALLDELTSHSPADMMRYMRRWPPGR